MVLSLVAIARSVGRDPAIVHTPVSEQLGADERARNSRVAQRDVPPMGSLSAMIRKSPPTRDNGDFGPYDGP